METTRQKSIWKSFLHHDNTPMLLVLLGIIIAITLIEGFVVRGGDFSEIAFIKGSNIANVLVQVSITGIMAIGMTVVMISGGMDLSCGQMVSLAGSFLAYLLVNKDLPSVSAILLTILLCIIFQVAMGAMIAYTKLEPFIVSLGFMSVYEGVAYLITQGREITIGNQIDGFNQTLIKFGNTNGSFYLGMAMLIFLLCVVIIWILLSYTKYGRWIYSVGGNEEAAYLAGISVKQFKIVLYGINGFFVALASIILLSRVGAGSPIMGSGKEIDVIAAVVVGGTALSGGKGNMWGTVIGVVLLGCITNAMNILGISPYYQYIMRGLLILLSIFIGNVGGRRKN